jgi:uncharacterized FlaG/YvyC family protein
MDVQAIDQGWSAAPAASTAPAQPETSAALQAFPHSQQGAQSGTSGQPSGDETLHNALSQLVGGGSNVSVQFEVTHDPDEVVTVFKNAQTGQVITQFPRESMVLIAQFFNKLAGAVVDRSA